MSQNPELGPQYSILKDYLIDYTKPNNKKAWFGLFMSLVYEIIAILLINFGFQIIGWALHTFNQVRIFVQFHDMAHFSYFTDINNNKFFGKIFGVYTHFPFNSWRDGHNHHHKHFGNLDRLDLSQTIFFTKKQYEQMKGFKKLAIRILRQPIVFFFFSQPYVWFIGIFFTNIKRYGVFSSTTLQKLISFFLYSYGFSLIGVSCLKMFLSVYFANIIGTILFHLQHSVNLPYRERKDTWNFTKAALEGSTYLEIPALLKPFTNGIQYHHIHHLNTNVASYAIGPCHHNFQQKNDWKVYNVNMVNFNLALKNLSNVMYDQQNDKLVPFNYSSL